MKKVAWPTRSEVINSSIVVIIGVVVMATIIFGFDYFSAPCRRLHLRLMTDTFDPSNNPESDRGTPESGDEMQPFEAQFASDSPVATDDDASTTRPTTSRTRRRRGRRQRPPTAAEAGAELLEDAEVIEIEAVPESEPSPYDRPGRWYVVHTYAGYENKVKSEPREPRPFDERRGPDLRGRHPDGRRHRVQERPQGRRAEEGLPRLPARAHGPRRRRLVRRAQHARRHRVRRQRRQAHATSRARRSRTSSAPARRSRARPPRRRSARGSSTKSASRCGSSPVRSPTSTV